MAERKKILGRVSKFKSEAAAWKEVELLKLGRKGSPETVEQLTTSLPVLDKREAAYWMSKIMQIYIKPVAAQLGIPLKGWHTLCHSYTNVLRQTGTTPKLFRIC